MSITAAIVLFASIWSVVLFMVLPFGMVSQADDGDVMPGTPASAPANPVIVRKAIITTIIAVFVFAIVWSVIEFRLVTLDDFPLLSPPRSA